MNEAKKIAYAKQAEGIIKGLAKRNMEGFYCATKEEAVEKVKELVEKGSSVTWGGSVTLSESGVMELLKNGDYDVLDRSTAKTPKEQRALYQKSVGADYFFMSTNAITLDGELVNIDGNGNRVACLIHGPKYVIVIAGVNKIVPDIESAVPRIRNVSSPANAARLHPNTPCEMTGMCGDCQSPGGMCCEIVVTRRSRHEGRIKVILVGEELGF